MHSLCSNMGALFIPQDEDAAIFCMDPAFSYFIVSGTLLPVARQCTYETSELNGCEEDSGDRLSPWFDANAMEESMPTVARHRQQHSYSEFLVGANVHAGEQDVVHQVSEFCDEGETLDPPTKQSDNDIGPQAHGSDFSTENSSTHGQGSRLMSLRVESILLNMKPESSAKFRGEDAPLRSGHGIDKFLRHAWACDEIACGNSITSVRDKASIDPTKKRKAVGVIAMNPERRWRLYAKSPVCIGRVSRRALKRLELEEPRWEMEGKVALLQRSEIFCKDFALSVLRELALVMERHKHLQASVVLRKGAIADKVLVVASGDAIRLGDRRADSVQNASSLRINTGQFFGAEEVVAMLPVYTSNLMASRALVSYTIPADAFREAIRGIRSPVLRRIVGRARVIANHSVEISEVRDSLSSRVREGHYPNITAGVESERPLHRRLIASDGSLPTLKPSETTPSPVGLSPIPFFSTSAARDYMRVTGTRPETDPEKSMNSMAAVFTPWTWRPPDRKKRAKHSCEIPRSPTSTPETDDAWPSVRHRSAGAPCVLLHSSPSPTSSVLEHGDVNGRVHSRELRTAENNARNGAGNDVETGANCVDKTAAGVASPDFWSLGPCESFATITTSVGHDGSGFPPSDRAAFTYSSDVDASHGSESFSRPIATTDIFSKPPRDRPGQARLTHHRSSTANPYDGHTREMQNSNLATQQAGSAQSISRLDKRGSGDTKNAGSPIVALPSCTASACQWDKEMIVARRAVSGRTKRQAVCRLFTTREGVAAGMTAAQRALRGPFVMSRMGNARARALWRPATAFMI